VFWEHIVAQLFTLFASRSLGDRVRRAETLASEAIGRLISGLNRLPGIGAKSARRIALDLLTWDLEQVKALARMLVEVKTQVRQCSVCYNLTEVDPCAICADVRRDRSVIVVVDYVADLLAFEQMAAFRGTYHVLDGRISPLDGVGPEDLHVNELLERAAKDEVKEVILANGPTVEGDATAQYLSNQLAGMNLRVTQIARGLPVGSDLSLADQVTLSRALEGRREM
jgi:recombination protein RecR